MTSLTSGLALTALEARASEDSFYKIDVPKDQELLNITTGGATADCDMYVRFGRRPGTSCSTFDYKSTSTTSEKSVTVSSPLEGWCRLKGYLHIMATLLCSMNCLTVFN